MESDSLSKEVTEKLDAAWFDAQVAIKNRNYDTAIQKLKSILNIDSKNAAAYNRLAIVYAKLRKLNISKKYFKKAVRLEPSSSSLHNLGLIYYELKNYKKAMLALHRSLSLEEHPLAVRHIAIAKAYEKMEYFQQTLEHLKIAAEIETSPQTKAIYIEAYKKYSTDKILSDELIESLVHTKSEWSLDFLDKYPVLVDTLSSVNIALINLVSTQPNKHISKRTQNTRILTIAYTQNLSACVNLLNKNYSLAATNIARSMFEIYLKIGYGLQSTTNRHYAIQELDTLRNKFGASRRMIQNLSITDPLYVSKSAENRVLQIAINALNRQYRSLQTAPSYRKMAILLDGGLFVDNYNLYEKLYEKGSDAIHANGDSIARIIELAGARQTGLFIDSFELLNTLTDLSCEIGKLYLTLPEVSIKSKNTYKVHLRKLGYSF